MKKAVVLFFGLVLISGICFAERIVEKVDNYTLKVTDTFTPETREVYVTVKHLLERKEAVQAELDGLKDVEKRLKAGLVEIELLTAEAKKLGVVEEPEIVKESVVIERPIVR